MKKKNTTAILLATVMMLALMGCGDTSAAAPSSTDTASVAEVNTDSDTKTDSTSDTSTDESSDSSSSESTDKTDSATASGDDSFEYNGETFSILDDFQTTKKKADAVCKPVPDYPVLENGDGSIYQYDPLGKGETQFMFVTFTNNDTETVGQLSVSKPDFKTSKGIGIGSTVEDVVATYGEPTKKSSKDTVYQYKLDNYYIFFDIMDGKVFSIDYMNLDYYNSRK